MNGFTFSASWRALWEVLVRGRTTKKIAQVEVHDLCERLNLFSARLCAGQSPAGTVVLNKALPALCALYSGSPKPLKR
eukprot:5932368-Amphidinium_carterae.1